MTLHILAQIARPVEDANARTQQCPPPKPAAVNLQAIFFHNYLTLKLRFSTLPPQPEARDKERQRNKVLETMEHCPRNQTSLVIVRDGHVDVFLKAKAEW